MAKPTPLAPPVIRAVAPARKTDIVGFWSSKIVLVGERFLEDGQRDENLTWTIVEEDVGSK